MSINYRYNEDRYLREFKEYIDATYGQHYSQNRLQATEFIIDAGHGNGFCIGNILKYAQRYGKKGTPHDARKDIMKVLHYAMMQLHVHDQTYPSRGSCPRRDFCETVYSAGTAASGGGGRK